MVRPTRVHCHTNYPARRDHAIARHPISHCLSHLLRIKRNGDQFVGKKSFRLIIIGIEYDNTAMNLPDVIRWKRWRDFYLYGQPPTFLHRRRRKTHQAGSVGLVCLSINVAAGGKCR